MKNIPDLAATTSTRRSDTSFLDGIRGLAALYVVVNHAVIWYLLSGRSDQSGNPALDNLYFLTFGRFSVAIFIVLSGYVLAKPIAESDGLKLRNGAIGFLMRRARRILPPYYAALILSLLAIYFLPSLSRPSTPMWDTALPVDKGALISHLLMVHNFNDAWIYKINPPLWSVATEVQIYFALPVLAILWRRYGIAVAALIGIVGGLLPCLVLQRADIPGSPWMLALFVMGMAASEHSFNKEKGGSVAGSGWIAAALTAILAVLCFAFWNRQNAPWIWSELLVGMTCAFFLLTCARSRSPIVAAIKQILGARALVRLGIFSYSLYLVHQPILSLVASVSPFASAGSQLGWVIFLGIPASIVTAYVFHLIFERPFLPIHYAKEQASVRNTQRSGEIQAGNGKRP